MPDLVEMKSKTTFQNPRVMNDKNGLVEPGDTFRTDLVHAQDLERLGHADPVGESLDGREPAPLEPHYQVSAGALAADQKRRTAAPAPGKAAEPVKPGAGADGGR